MRNFTEVFIERFCKKYSVSAIERDYSLAAHTTMRVGGSAALAVFPETQEMLCDAIKLCKQLNIKHAVLGHGSNVVCSDCGYDGIIIKTDRLSSVSVTDCELVAECGASLNSVARAALGASLTGAEFMFGIPGSVGGACYMNAGAYGGQMSDVIISVTAYDSALDKTALLSVDECNFGYRQSVFHENDRYTVLSCKISLLLGNKSEIENKMNELMAARKEKQPLEYPSAGSFFKRCEGYFTAKLIDDCGLKGRRVGGAMISEKHAGFLINYDNATCEDIMRLADEVKAEVKNRFGVDIEREVEYLG